MAASLSRSSGGDRYVIQQNADINVTPFVDIMLVLLIIFMVSIPPPTASLKLDLPPAPPNAEPVAKKPVFISVGADGSLSLGGFVDKPTSAAALPGDLAAALNAAYPENAADPHRNMVLIRADADVQYDRFMDVLNELEENGYLKIGLISETMS